MKKLTLAASIVAILILGTAILVPRFSIQDSNDIGELYGHYNDREEIYGFSIIKLPLKKFVVIPRYINTGAIKVVEARTDSPENTIYDLLVYSKKFKYNTTQPFPYEHELLEKGGNCQALSLWLSKQLTHYGVSNQLYLSEGNDHMYNILTYDNKVVKVDLANREVSNG